VKIRDESSISFGEYKNGGESRILKTVIKRAILLACVLTMWEICSWYTNQIFIPKPKAVFENLWILIKNGEIFIAIQYSFLRVTLAAFSSALIAIPIALLIYNVKIAKDISNN